MKNIINVLLYGFFIYSCVIHVFAHETPFISHYEVIDGKVYFDEVGDNIFEDLKLVDIESFETIETTHYARDKNYVYFSGKIVKNAEPLTFTTLFTEGGINDTFAKDKNYVFHGLFVIEGADPYTFKVENDYISSDKNNIFLNSMNKLILGIDRKSFLVIAKTKIQDKNGIYIVKSIYNREKMKYEMLIEEVESFANSKENIDLGLNNLNFQDPNITNIITLEPSSLENTTEPQNIEAEETKTDTDSTETLETLESDTGSISEVTSSGETDNQGSGETVPDDSTGSTVENNTETISDNQTTPENNNKYYYLVLLLVVIILFLVGKKFYRVK